MKKKHLLVFLFIISVFCLTGCFKKEVINPGKFADVMKEKGFNVGNATEMFKEVPQIVSATIATNKDGVRIEFYELKTKENATEMFEYNRKAFEKEKKDDSSETSYKNKNYEIYALGNADTYMYMCMVDNTLLYTTVYADEKEMVRDIIKDLKY